MNNLVAYVNDGFVPLETANFPVSDLGIQRGYGVFDFFRAKGAAPLFLQKHLDRLFHSMEVMRLTLPYTRVQLERLIGSLLEQNDLSHSGVRITVTGGPSISGYSITKPHIAIVQQPIPPPPDAVSTDSYRLITYAHQRQLPKVKTTDYLMAIWLQPYVQAHGADDVLYVTDSMVTECPRSNFFLVTANGTLLTPGNGILKGITRAHILKLAQQELHMEVEERQVTLADIAMAKEAFVSSTTKRIIPVTAVNEKQFGPYSANAVCAKLFEALKALEG